MRLRSAFRAPNRVLAAAALTVACRAAPPADGTDVASLDARRLPTGHRLDPAGASTALGSMPLGAVLAPGGDAVAVVLSGWREQGLQIVDRTTGRVRQTLPQRAAFIGAAWSPDGRWLAVSGGDADLIYRYAWRDGAATLTDTIRLAQDTTEVPRRLSEPGAETGAAGGEHGTRYPAGLAFSPDGARLYVAENLGDAVAVVDVATGRVLQRIATERYPYAVVVAPTGVVYVSAWGGNTVSILRPDPADGGRLRDRRVVVGRHPSALLLNGDASRLFIASASTDRVIVMDTRRGRVLTQLPDPAPAGPREGSTPDALALSPDGRRLYVAEADNDAVAVFALGAVTAGGAPAGRPADAGAPVPDESASATQDRLIGRVPVEWYPTALVMTGDTLLVVNGKGRGTGPNPEGPNPRRLAATTPHNYTLGQTSGTLTLLPPATLADGALGALTARVARANAWTDAARTAPRYPPFRHVIYVIKENRTYDQIFGDLKQGDGDTTLQFFDRAVTPNLHALAERFGTFDRFFVNAEVSADGHNWSTAAYATDYTEKTVPSNYSTRGRSYDYEGTNRGALPPDDDDAASPASGYLWNLAEAAGITFRNFGEYVVPDREAAEGGPLPAGYMGVKPYLRAHTDPAYPGFDLTIPDQHRADVFLRALAAYERAGEMPALQIVRLPNDHTAGGAAGFHSPRALVADNDLALGRIMEALSRSPFWASTVVFVLEDDAQNGADHVDSHRAPLLVMSAYNRGGGMHRFTNTTDVLATIEDLLGLGRLSQFDFYGRPLRGIWASDADLRPYVALPARVSLDERNPAAGRNAVDSRRLDLRFEDVSDDALFNRILWRMAKGDGTPMPAPARLSALEVVAGGGGSR